MNYYARKFIIIASFAAVFVLFLQAMVAGHETHDLHTQTEYFKRQTDQLKRQNELLLTRIRSGEVDAEQVGGQEMLIEKFNEVLGDVMEARAKEIQTLGDLPELLDYCGGDSCLNEEVSLLPIGVARVEGFYRNRMQKRQGEKKACDSFILTGGSQVLADGFKRLIDQGDTINALTKNEEPIVNLNLLFLADETQEAIRNSTRQEPVSMYVFIPYHIRGETPACYSYVDVLGTE